MFENRRTGRITIAQWPNLPLAIYIVAAIGRRLADGTLAAALSVVATAALIWWAVDEIVRGVNPFRRALGAIVLTLTVADVISG